MEKLKLRTQDFTGQNITRLAELFPSCVTEAADDQGRLKKAIDFDLLRQELSDSIVDGPRERYHLDWPGKKAALVAANTPIAKTLRPCREESVDFDTTKNLFIEGDNLDALKLLQETYLNKVKMIYIDPPYNTGKDFIYRDNFTESKDAYLHESGQHDADGNRLVANTESKGRFHSDWLSMMYPRLKLVSCNLNSLAFDEAYFDFSTPVVSKKAMVSHRCFVPQALRDKRHSPKGLCLFLNLPVLVRTIRTTCYAFVLTTLPN